MTCRSVTIGFLVPKPIRKIAPTALVGAIFFGAVMTAEAQRATAADRGDYIVLDNGLVRVEILKSNATIPSSILLYDAIRLEVDSL